MKLYTDDECIYAYSSKGQPTFGGKGYRKASLKELQDSKLTEVLKVKEYNGWYELKLESGKKIKLDYSEAAYVFRFFEIENKSGTLVSGDIKEVE